MRIAVAALVLIALVVPLTPADAASYTVTASNFQWSPAFLQIDVGDEVTFTNGGGVHEWALDDRTDSCPLPCTRSWATDTTVAYHCTIHGFMTGTIQVGDPVEISVTSPVPGATIGGLVVVTGTASHPTQEIRDITVAIDQGSPVPGSIDGGAWSVQITTEGVSEGAHVLVVRASATSVTGTVSVPIVVDNPDMIDVGITSVSAPSGATTSSAVTYQVRNQGNVDTGFFAVRAEYLYQGVWHPIGDVTQQSMPPGRTTFGSVPWDPPGVLVGRFTLRVTADPANELNDPDLTDNVRTGNGGWFTSNVEGIDLLDPL